MPDFNFTNEALAELDEVLRHLHGYSLQARGDALIVSPRPPEDLKPLIREHKQVLLLEARYREAVLAVLTEDLCSGDSARAARSLQVVRENCTDIPPREIDAVLREARAKN